MRVYVEVLLYIVRDGEVLLIRKRRGLGAGYINGVGGKVEPGEDPQAAVVREAVEEVGVKPIEPRWTGLLEFWNYDDEGVEFHYVHVYVANRYEGELRSSEEAEPIWFKIDDVPYNQMWEDDRYWLPLVLSGKMIYGRFRFRNWRMMDGFTSILENCSQVSTNIGVKD
jgi:8-oxo-dGTP diphosphatase